jgi:hypothetical protein
MGYCHFKFHYDSALRSILGKVSRLVKKDIKCYLILARYPILLLYHTIVRASPDAIAKH